SFLAPFLDLVLPSSSSSVLFRLGVEEEEEDGEEVEVAEEELAPFYLGVEEVAMAAASISFLAPFLDLVLPSSSSSVLFRLGVEEEDGDELVSAPFYWPIPIKA
ncbi:MAG: hypothetical protein AAGJ80_11325, partial [Cyanobacteria bacterium J06553_1]